MALIGFDLESVSEQALRPLLAGSDSVIVEFPNRKVTED